MALEFRGKTQRPLTEADKEREAVRTMAGDLAVYCLWDPRVNEATGETKEHKIRAWREPDCIKVEVKRK